MAFLVSRRLLFSKCIKLNRRYGAMNSEKPVFGAITDGKAKELSLEFDGNSDVFGTLSKNHHIIKEMEALPEEEGDIDVRTTYGVAGKRRLLVVDYANMIKKCVNEKRLMDAIEIFEQKMLKQDDVRPQSYFYNLLIDACAKAGYSKKAFQLYNQMKKRGLKVGGTTYTSLFNACALSTVDGDGLKRAKALRELVQEKGVILNQTNYHAMIKAFGWCGDLETAFSLVDEMLQKKIKVSADTFSFLIQACISDKEVGFRHALVLWRKMLQKRIQPKVHNYNLMLRCARDCGMGNEEAARQLLAAVVTQANIGSIESCEQKKIEFGKHSGSELSNPLSSSNSTSLVPAGPNLLARGSDFSGVTDIGTITTPQDRLMLMGGSLGFLNNMLENNVVPDTKTVTQLVDLLPPLGRAEVDIMDFMKKHKVRMDIGFCNNLIKRRNLRGDYLGSLEVLKVINLRRLKPDIVTFGALAVACRTLKEAEQLLEDMFAAGYRINIEVAGGLVNSGHHTMSPEIIRLAIDSLAAENVNPNSRLIAAVDKFIDTVELALENQKLGRSYDPKIDSDRFLKDFQELKFQYLDWKNSVEIDGRDNQHPWRQFRRSQGQSAPELLQTEVPVHNFYRKKWKPKAKR